MLRMRSKVGWELFSPFSWMLLGAKMVVLSWTATHRKAQARTQLPCGLFICGKKPFFSLPLSDNGDGLRRNFFLITWQIIFNLVHSNGPSYTCNISSDGTTLVFLFQTSSLWINFSADCSEQCHALLIVSQPNMITVLFTHFTYSPFPAWAWCHPLDDVLHQKVLMYSSQCHILLSWKMTCYIPSFSGVQVREDVAPQVISVCDFWWSARSQLIFLKSAFLFKISIFLLDIFKVLVIYIWTYAKCFLLSQ